MKDKFVGREACFRAKAAGDGICAHVCRLSIDCWAVSLRLPFDYSFVASLQLLQWHRATWNDLQLGLSKMRTFSCVIWTYLLKCSFLPSRVLFFDTDCHKILLLKDLSCSFCWNFLSSKTEKRWYGVIGVSMVTVSPPEHFYIRNSVLLSMPRI